MSTGSIRRHRDHAVGGEAYTGAGVTTSDDLTPTEGAPESPEEARALAEAAQVASDEGKSEEGTATAPTTVQAGEEGQPDTDGGLDRNDDASTDTEQFVPGGPTADEKAEAGGADPEAVKGAGDTIATPEDADAKPAGNASREAWVDYALSNGASHDDLDGLGRDAIRDLYAD